MSRRSAARPRRSGSRGACGRCDRWTGLRGSRWRRRGSRRWERLVPPRTSLATRRRAHPAAP
ncbi:hypothetical protein ACFPM0_20950 [Pseudonocardia sulfidoxydans]|uniref:hypothetical protein n=1 Tax=Pseudonocardia sulfidoxydans TaxID=54011 RepID=UPI00360F4A43